MANNTGKKFGGRKTGTPNKTTKETRELLQSIIQNELENLPTLLEELTPNQKADIICKLMQFVIAKPTVSIEMTEKLNVVKILPEWLNDQNQQHELHNY